MNSNRDYGESHVSKVQMLCLKLEEANKMVLEKDAKLQNLDQVNKELDSEIQTLREKTQKQTCLVETQKNELEASSLQIISCVCNISILEQKLMEMEKTNSELATKLNKVETEKKETEEELKKLKEEIDIGMDKFICTDRSNDVSSPIQSDNQEVDEPALDLRPQQKQANEPTEKNDNQNVAGSVKVENNRVDDPPNSSISVANAAVASGAPLTSVYSTTHGEDFTRKGRFVCKCRSKFSSVANLRKHIHHFTQRNFSCQNCTDIRFPTFSKWKQHMQIKHGIDNFGDAKGCSPCGIHFDTKELYNEHRRQFHQPPPPGRVKRRKRKAFWYD